MWEAVSNLSSAQLLFVLLLLVQANFILSESAELVNSYSARNDVNNPATSFDLADADTADASHEPELIINHLNQNHYSSDSSDSEADSTSGLADLQENHMGAEHGDEDGNGPIQAGVPGCEGGAELVLMDEQPTRYLSPAALKKHIHTETTKVNNELRALITKEIRKPGRRM